MLHRFFLGGGGWIEECILSLNSLLRLLVTVELLAGLLEAGLGTMASVLREHKWGTKMDQIEGSCII
jgi:hypothetical protein